jgi:hypothetical protein
MCNTALSVIKLYMTIIARVGIELKFRETFHDFHHDEEREKWILNRFTYLFTYIFLLSEILGYLLGYKSIKTLIVGLQKIEIFLQ